MPRQSGNVVSLSQLPRSARRRTIPSGKVIIGGRNVCHRHIQIAGVNSTHHKTIQVYTSATDLVFRFTNFSMAATKEAVAGSSITIRPSVRVNGQNHEITRNGIRDLVINAGAGYIDSDPVSVGVTAGTSIIVSTYMVAAATLPYGTGWADGTFDTYSNGDTSGPSGTVGAGAGAQLYGPSLVLGTPQAGATVKPVVAIVGDSVARGHNDASLYGADGAGFIVRALESASLPWVMAARFSSAANDWIDLYGRKIRAGLIADCDYAVVSLGSNDWFALSRTAAQAEADLISTCNTMLTRRGVPSWVCTVVPVSTSTDSWATTGNQTTHASNTQRLLFNNWVRAGLPLDNSTSLTPVAVGTGGALLAGQAGHPVSGYFEIADITESARDSGLWKVNGSANFYTSDGIHPGSVAHTAMAAAIDITKFV